ncbi:hypothetical protein MLD38_019857 [Melastoma candidum]|uniref:Uncharacterized protein n=1 Tax=Melastoma candidum TaxID=119954 RepID=A0ACB9QJ28_9MYRT|nr:hypothetical protein MLD38_019857 [Melastoma candidum]
MEAVDLITDRRYPKRILFLVDLTPLALLRHDGRASRSYLDRVLSATKPFLCSPEFSTALFAFKPFFSSLSPLLSSSKLPPPFSSLHLSFLDPPQTLASLSRALVDLQDRDFESVSASPRASLIAAGLRQILHEYDWGTVLDDDDSTGNSFVVLFSPVGRSEKWVREFLESNADDDGGESGVGKSDFCGRACEVLSGVRDVFVSKRIHLCWVDVEYEAEGEAVEGEGVIELAGFKEGIKRLGWGFCSSESIVLGSAILPFGLISPDLISSPHFLANNCGKTVRGSLNLKIMDVSNKPLGCKCCDIELMDYKIRDRNQTQVSLSQEFVNLPDADMERGDNKYHNRLSNREVKICFLSVQKHERFPKLREHFMEPILVTEYLRERRNDEKDGKRHEFFANKVLDLLAKDMGEFGRMSLPLWQIILSFMYREGYWALVSLQDEDGKSKCGILKPFTYSSALLFLCNDDIADPSVHDAFDTPESKNSGSDPSCSRKNYKQGEAEKRRSNLHLLQNLSWDDFRKEAIEGFEIRLEEEFFAWKQNQSKKLKFLKCWMKQVAKEASKPPANIKRLSLEDGDSKMNDPRESPRETEHPVSASASAAEDSMTAASMVQDEVAVENDVESFDDFLGSIPRKIRQGIELEGADLGALAERLVHSAIYWISQKYDSELALESQSFSVATEVMDLLLSEPKELADKSKKDPANLEKDASSLAAREFELQILFRMEILRSQVAGAFKDYKQRFVKQICVLLECIQCQMEGGFFGDWSLDDYVEKIIKRRYFEILEDVVNQIYSRMDLLLFNDEDEVPLNSEDSYKSSRDGAGGEDVASYLGCTGSNSTEDRPSQDEDHLRRLSNARERRERARRFKSFTNSMPDLLRVWAPKVLTSAKNKTDSSRRKLRTRETFDMVLETPSTENKRFCRQIGRPHDQQVSTSQSGASVSKTLFPEDL